MHSMAHSRSGSVGRPFRRAGALSASGAIGGSLLRLIRTRKPSSTVRAASPKVVRFIWGFL